MCLVHGGMFELPPSWLALQYDPISGVTFHEVSHLHGGASLLQLEFDIGLGLVAVDRDLFVFSVHRGNID